MDMELKRTTYKVEKLVNLKSTNKLSFDLVIQRKDDIWDRNRKSLLIHSVLNDFPIPSVFANKEENVYHVLDGKQRLTTLIDYVDGKFKLSKSVPAIQGEVLAEKKFAELPEEWKQKINQYGVSIEYIEGLGQERMEEWFFRLNNGVPLRKIENTRAILGGKVLKFVEDIAKMEFFTEKTNLSASARKRYVDQEMILQIMALIQNKETGFSSLEIQEFVKTLRNSEIRDELKARMQNASRLLNVAFPKKEKFLKKLHVPMLFKLALDIQKYGLLITEDSFGEFARQFFDHVPEEYAQACVQGSAKKENVQRRLAAISKAFNEYFQIQERGQEMFASETGNSQDAV
jgi:hypothetical protein